MRKFFYGISVFLFLCILSLGYYSSYQRTDARRSRGDGAAPPVEALTEGQTVSADSGAGGYGLFYLKETKGLVTVYEKDRKTVYEPTKIPVSMLPEKLRKEICRGKYIKTQEELYSFLENYSS